MGERTNPEDIGFVIEKRIDITNPEILESPEAIELLRKSEGYCIIGDFVLTYKVSKNPEYNDIVDANILSIKEGTNPNWRKIESYKKEGYHENEAVTFKISKHPKGYGMQFISLSKGTLWPRQGSISVVNPEIVPVPDFEGDLAFFDFIVSYNLKDRSGIDSPLLNYSAEIKEARFLRPTLKDEDEN
jgi:hypothetical protein